MSINFTTHIKLKLEVWACLKSLVCGELSGA